MESTATLTRLESGTQPELTALDRCDVCGARAWVRVCMPSGQLLFCAHHANQHMPALRTQAVSIQDNRYLLLEDEA